MNLGVKRSYLFLALAVLFLVLVLFSCGKGKSRTSGAAVTGMAGRDARPTDGQYSQQPKRELSLVEVIAEVEAYEPPGDVDAGVFDELRLELIRVFEELGAERFPIRTPSGDGEGDVEIGDVFVQPLQDGSNAIRWNEILEGDLNGDGEVTIADVSPIARNYLDVYSDGEGDTEDWFITRAAGGDDEITIADVAVVARNYLSTGPDGYDVWRVPMGGGEPVRIETAADPDAPTVSAGDAFRTGDRAAEFDLLDAVGSAPSSLRSVSQAGDGEVWSNGDYYYVVDARMDAAGAPPTEPGSRKFNILVKYNTAFRVDVDVSVTARVMVFGDVTPAGYSFNWGDGSTDALPTSEYEAVFTHAYDSEGVYVPFVEVTGDAGGGEEMLIQSAPPPHVNPNLPYAPTGLSVSLLEDGNTYLNWDIIDPNPSETYNVYWSLRKGASSPELLTEGVSGNTYVDSTIAPSIAPGISVFYKVSAVRSKQESPFSNEYKWPVVTTEAPELTLLGSSSDERVDLSWSAVPDSPYYDVEGYRVYKGYELGDLDAVPVSGDDPLPDTETSFSYDTLSSETALYFFVTTAADVGASGRSNEVFWERSIGPPAPPENLGAEAGNNSVKVTWDASPSEGVDGYRVYYGTEEDGSDKVSLAGTDETTREYTVIDSPEHPVENGTTYYFWVSALRGGEESIQTGPIAAVPGNESPVASFTSVPGLPYTGNPGDAINFTSTSIDPDGSIVYYAWDFDGDGTPDNSGSGLSSVEHTYNEEGNFQPSLTVTDDDGASDTFTGGNVKIGTGFPTAVANADPASGIAPLNVNFSAEGSFDPDGTIVEYSWKFFVGDDYHDYTFEGGSAFHQYAVPGVYLATLRVTDNDGKNAYDGIEIAVNAPPTAVANASPTNGTKPLQVSFNADGSYDPDGEIVLWEWDWENDGAYDWSSDINGNRVYTYTEYGDFTAKLRVTDDDGATGTDTVAIHVNAPPIADANATPNSGLKPLEVNFDADGSGDLDGTIVLYEWDWDGDGNYDWESGTSGTTPHTYNDHGDYTPMLRVTDDEGATDTDTVAIHVNAAPIAGLSADPTEGEPPLTVNFDASESYDPFGDITKYEWDWNGDALYDFNSGTDPTVEHTYNDGGTYNATVKVTDNEGATDTASVKITVGNPTWHIETVDSGGNVGQMCSIALDSSDNPHISHHSEIPDYDLKYAYFDGSSWQIETVDSVGFVGNWTSLAVDSSNNLHISHYDGSQGNLKYAYFDGASWWNTTVDSGGNVGYYTSIAVDSSNNPHISYLDSTNQDLKYAYNDGTSWQTETVDSEGAVGRSTSIALDSSGNPHISYWDYTPNYDLKYAYFDGTSWQIETVDAEAGVGTGDYHASIAVDSSNNPHISYLDLTNSDLKYAYYSGTSWQIETVDSEGLVGYWASIALGSSDNPHISYRDQTNKDLKYAYYSGSSWQIETVDSEGNVGGNNSIALDSSGSPHISYRDTTNNDLKYAYWK